MVRPLSLSLSSRGACVRARRRARAGAAHAFLRVHISLASANLFGFRPEAAPTTHCAPGSRRACSAPTYLVPLQEAAIDAIGPCAGAQVRARPAVLGVHRDARAPRHVGLRSRQGGRDASARACLLPGTYTGRARVVLPPPRGLPQHCVAVGSRRTASATLRPRPPRSAGRPSPHAPGGGATWARRPPSVPDGAGLALTANTCSGSMGTDAPSHWFISSHRERRARGGLSRRLFAG